MKTLASLLSLATLAVAMSTAAFAARNKNEGNFTLADTVRVGSTDLKAGQYKAQWKDDGSGAVKVDILQHGKVVATTEGKLKNLEGPAPYDAVVTKPLDNNTKTIDEIDFGRRTEALMLGE
jgi:hypothetical protein